jgi:hypothetical protein
MNKRPVKPGKPVALQNIFQAFLQAGQKIISLGLF